MSTPKSKVVVYTGRLTDEKGVPIGVKGVGKDTAARLLAKLAPQYDHIFLSFADALKDTVAEYYSLDRAYLDTPEHKEEPLDKYPGWSWRRLLEVFGTDVVRKIDGEVWMGKIEQRIMFEIGSLEERMAYRVFGDRARNLADPDTDLDMDEPDATRTSAMIHLMGQTGLPKPVHLPRPKMLHVTDCRFKNEYDMLRSLRWDGIHVHVLQICRTSKSSGSGAAHPSNTFYADMFADTLITNNGTLEDLEAIMKRVLMDLVSDA